MRPASPASILAHMNRTSLSEGTWCARAMLVATLLAGSACADDAMDTTADGGGGQGGGGGEGGAPPACPAGAHELEDGSCEASLTAWTPGPMLLTGRDHHVSFAAETPAGAFLYTLVGTNPLGGAAATVERAAIAGDGALAPFEPLANLPAGLIGPGFAQLDRSWVLVGGLAPSGDSTPECAVGLVQDDGALALQPGAALAQSRYHTAVVALNGLVFATGGMQQTVSGGTPMQTVLDSVERASFDGATLGPWVEVGPLPEPRTHHAAVAHGGAIYVIGGGSDAAATTDIWRAEVSDSGELGPFAPAGALPEARATASAFVFLDHLYVVAGMVSLVSGEVATVLRAAIAEDGSVGTFEELPALPLARAHSHQAPFHAGFVYSVAGSIDHVDQREVFIGRFE
jgi:hypothetical protein